ncbi:MAG TPA: acetamidase/formamidase family protein, partial [Thermoleophilaceae bacterium]|nr:acetamidase/formamidase family protein [Thermoleophilaceae bacterium]
MSVRRLSREEPASFDLVAAEPRLSVDPGETFVVEVADAFGGALRSEDDLPTEAAFGDRLAREEFNACAGPIAVSTALPGDALVVTVEDIVVDEQGVTALFEGVGPPGDPSTYPDCWGPLTKVIAHEPGPGGTTSDGFGVLDGRLRWPLAPHIGTIATAPARPLSSGADANYGQGPFGGNLDCRHVSKGSRIWLPVAVEGACLYVGDVHGSMADGELYGVADESGAELVLSCEVVKGKSVPFMRIETAEALVQVNSAKPLEDAVLGAFRMMLDWLVADHGLSSRDAYLLLGLHPEVRVEVYQVVKLGRLNFTAGVAFPKSALQAG